MPTVPRADQSPVPTAPLPGVRVSTQAPAGAFGGQPMSIDSSGLGRHAAAIIQQEREKQDQVAVLEADNALAEIETSLLNDPKTGVLNRKGKNAFGAPEEVAAEWQKRTSEVESKLTTERQQMAFRQRVQGRWQSLNGTVQRHVAGEIERHDNETANAAQANRLDLAVRSAGDPATITSAVTETQAIISDYARRNGWSPEQLEEKKTAAVSRIHAGVIDQMLSQGNDRAAADYFAQNKASIAGAQLPGIEKALEQASTDGAGMRAADAVWQKLGPKGGNDPVKVATMEQALRDELGDNPKVIRAAIAEVRSRATAFNAEQAEATAANKAALLGAFNNGASPGAIKARPEYRALSGSEQESLSAYIEGRTQQRTARAEDEQTRRQFRAYWELSGVKALHQMSENTILALEPSLGRTLVGQIMQQKRALGARDATAEARVLAATIDEDLFKTVAADAGLNPYGTGLSDDEKETLGRLKVSVETEIARVQDKINKPLTQSEKREVMQKIVDTKVMRDSWGSDDKVIAGTIRRDASGRLPTDIYVPIEQVPAETQKEALNWLRSVGAIRQGTDDAAAMRQVGNRIGKAYAARLAGATRQEIEQILRGQR